MNYFEYFTEIEDRFTARRGTILLLSTLDWALIETWREAGIPLAAVLRGIDTAFDRYDARKARAKNRLARVNGLAWCAQAVLDAATELAEAATGLEPSNTAPAATGFEADRIAAFLESNAKALDRACERSIRHPAAAAPPASSGNPQLDPSLSAAHQTNVTPSTPITADAPLSAIGWRVAAADTANRLRALATEVRAGSHPALDELDRTLTVLEERLQAAVLAGTPESDLLSLRETADRELAPTKLSAPQRRHIRDSFVQKRLFDTHKLPRLSLFYMPVVDSPSPLAECPHATPTRPDSDAAA